MPDTPSTDTPVDALVHEVKRRWRRRALMRGAALTLFVLLASAAVLLALRAGLGAPLWLVGLAGAIGGLATAWALLAHVVRPWRRVIRDREVALYVEERVPEMEDRLNSAVEIGRLDAGTQDALLDRLARDAARRTDGIPVRLLVDPQQAQRLLYGAGVAALALLVAGYVARDDLVAPAPVVDLGDADAAAVPSIRVTPGDAEVEQGRAQPITVELREATNEEVVLYYRAETDSTWRRQAMPETDAGTYRYVVASVQQPMRYAAQVGAARTDTFALSLYDFPEVRRVDLTYAYPSYTRQPERTETDAHAIRGLQGATVTLRVHASRTARQAALVLDGGETVPLERTADGAFRGQLALERSGTYRFRLTDAAGKRNPFPAAYEITVDPDAPPQVRLNAPRRDVRAHPVEEVEVAAEAEDDYGLKRAEIRYTVNDGDEEAIALAEASTDRLQTAAGAHRFFLETIDGLAPGDIITYYVEAEDYAPESTPQSTDLYFIEVVPFETYFSQASNQGGGGGGQQRSGTVLNQQQIINATWKLLRQRDGMAEAEFRASLDELRQAQRNLKADVEERIGQTAFSLELRADDKSQQVVAYLRTATGHMEEALARLTPGSLDEALTPERKALRQLLKADAQNKERQVALQRSRQQGAGGSGSATEQRMTELADLELDVSKDKYETQQQRPSAQQGGGGGDALERAQELARKQEDLMRQQQQPEVQGEDRRRQVERLRRQQEQLQHQARSLARSMQQGDPQQPSRTSSSSDARSARPPRAQEARRRMEEASRQMEEAQRALQRDDREAAARHQREALRNLNRLQEDLRRHQGGGVPETIDQMRATHRQLEEGQRARARATQEATEGAEAADAEALEAEQQRQQRRLQQLKSQAQAVAEDAEDEHPEAAAAARALREQVEDGGLEERMEAARQALRQGRMAGARRAQDAVREGLDDLALSMQRLQNSRPASEQERLARSLEEVQQMRRALEAAQQQRQQGGGQRGAVEQRLDDARQALRRMRESFEGNAGVQQGIDAAARALRTGPTGERLTGDAARDYFDQEVYAQLSALEKELAGRLEGGQLSERIYDARPEDAPQSYRTLVEQYYESLSKDDE